MVEITFSAKTIFLLSLLLNALVGSVSSFTCLSEFIAFYIYFLRSSWLVSRGESIHSVDAKLFTIGNVKLSLNGQRDKCAGTVEYTTQNGNFGVCKDSAWGKWTKKNNLFLISSS